MEGSAESSEKTCFVIGPIGKEGSPARKQADLLLKLIIEPAFNSNNCNYVVMRADLDPDPGIITSSIINRIVNSDIVIADLSDLNPNVFYELGIRHATQKIAISIAKRGTELPFDNATQRTIFFDTGDIESINGCRNQISSFVQATLAPNYEYSNAVTQARAVFEYRSSTSQKENIISVIHERLAVIEGLIRKQSGSKGGETGFQPVYFDGSDLIDNKNSQFSIDITGLNTISDFLDEVYYILRRNNKNIRPYKYGQQWVLIDANGRAIQTLKPRSSEDNRQLGAEGIQADTFLRICRPKPPQRE